MNKVISREYVEKNYIKGKDETQKYIDMIEAFECDFALARDGYRDLSHLSQGLKDRDEALLKDIDLLENLSFDLRHGKAKIINLEETKDVNK